MLRITRTTLGLALMLLLVTTPSLMASDPISACVNPAGQVRLIANGSSCRPQEQLVIWSGQGPQGPEGPEGPQGPQGPEGPGASGPGPALVLDSNDTIVGHYIDRTGDVLVHIGADHFIVGATRQGFVPTGSFIHREAGCTDPPSIVANVNALALAQVALVKPGAAWLPALTAAKINLPAGSTVFSQSFFADGSSTPCTQGVFFNAVTLMPLRLIPLSGFIAPFHLQ